MIEQGLVMKVQANAAVRAMVPVGGHFTTLPKDAPLPNWAWSVVSSEDNYTLRGESGLVCLRFQIDCFAADGPGAIRLARAIHTVLDGARGALPDPDSTFLDSCLRSNMIDFFDDAPRSYRRLLEYHVWFYQQ